MIRTGEKSALTQLEGPTQLPISRQFLKVMVSSVQFWALHKVQPCCKESPGCSNSQDKTEPV